MLTNINTGFRQFPPPRMAFIVTNVLLHHKGVERWIRNEELETLGDLVLACCPSTKPVAFSLPASLRLFAFQDLSLDIGKPPHVPHKDRPN